MKRRDFSSIVAAMICLASLPIATPAMAQTPTIVPNAAFDLTQNGMVNAADASLITSQWSTLREVGSCTNAASQALDLDSSNCVDVRDLQLLLAQWGTVATSEDAQRIANPAPQAEGGKTVTVNTKSDGADASPGDGVCEMQAGSGDCSLRAAVQETNRLPGRDTIAFDIRGRGGSCPSGVTALSVAAAPTIVVDERQYYAAVLLDDIGGSGTVLNGYTQCGARENSEPVTGNAIIKIEMKISTNRDTTFGVHIMSPNNEVRGLAIWNGADNIRLDGEAAYNNIIAGNIIGTNVAQNAKGSGSSISNSDNGLRIRNKATNNRIGGYEPRDRNIVAGSDGDGIYLNERANNNTIVGNYIGLRQDGVTAWGNGSDGFDINIGCQNNVIGGTEPGARNVISGNDGDGIEFSHTRQPDRITRGLKVINNYVGVSASMGQLKNPDGSLRTFGNGTEGLTLEDQVFDYEAYGNVIANNGANGIRLYFDTHDVYIHHNYIGILPDGTPMPNGTSTLQEAVDRGNDGIRLLADSSKNLISENIIAYNRGHGVRVDNHVHPNQGGTYSTRYNTISRNSIFNNDKQGIGFVSANNILPNMGIKPPTLQSADTYSVSGTTCANCTVEVFQAAVGKGDQIAIKVGKNTTYKPAGEGKQYLAASVADGTGAFRMTLPRVELGESLTATATDVMGNTSEFSFNIMVTTEGMPPIIVPTTVVPPTFTPPTPVPPTPVPEEPTPTAGPVIPTPVGGPNGNSQILRLPLIVR